MRQFRPCRTSRHVRTGATSTLVLGEQPVDGSGNVTGIVVTAGERQVGTDAEGRFEIEVDPAQAYLLTVTAPGYLSAQAEGEVLASSTVVDLGSVTLLGGEVTGDEQIDIFDLALIGSRYGSGDSWGDINGDGLVDIFDLTLSASNYGQRGPIVIGLDVGQ